MKIVKKLKFILFSLVLTGMAVLSIGNTTVSASSAYPISLANGVAAVAEIPDDNTVTVTNRVIVAAKAVNVCDSNGNMYCTAQPGIRVYEYGILSNGMSLIQYGVDGYAFTSSNSWYAEVSTPAVATINDQLSKVAEEKATRADMYGRFTISSAGIDVAIFYRDGDQRQMTALRQTFADNVDSATYSPCYMDPSTGYAWPETDWMIADHNNQNFSTLNKVSVGDTAYVNNGSTITEYKCIEVRNGINNVNNSAMNCRASKEPTRSLHTR